MRWGDVNREQQRTKQLFWSIKRQTKTRTGADPKDARAVNPNMFAVEGSERDPVRTYDLYASKRPGMSCRKFNVGRNC